jgi:hypothetical protein
VAGFGAFAGQGVDGNHHLHLNLRGVSTTNEKVDEGICPPLVHRAEVAIGSRVCHPVDGVVQLSRLHTRKRSGAGT